MRSHASASRARRPISPLVAIKPLRQPGIDGIEEGGERLRVGSGERFVRAHAARCCRARAAGRADRARAGAAPRRPSSRKARPRADAAVRGGSGGLRSADRWAARPTAAASAAATSVCAKGRNVTMRQRERNVAGTRAGRMADQQQAARAAAAPRGSSGAHWRPTRLSSSTASTMATRQPPSPAVEPKNADGAAHVVDGDLLAQHALLVERALDDEKVRLGLRRHPPRHRMLGIDRERTLPPALPPRPGLDGRARSGPCGRRASPCRCPWGRSSRKACGTRPPR